MNNKLQFSIEHDPKLDWSFQNVCKNKVSPSLMHDSCEFPSVLGEVFNGVPAGWFVVDSTLENVFGSALWVIALSGLADCEIITKSSCYRWSGCNVQQHEFVTKRKEALVRTAFCASDELIEIRSNCFYQDPEIHYGNFLARIKDTLSLIDAGAISERETGYFSVSTRLENLPTIKANESDATPLDESLSQRHLAACIQLMNHEFENSFGFTWKLAAIALAVCFKDEKVPMGDGTLRTHCKAFCDAKSGFELPKFKRGKKKAFIGFPESAKKILEKNGAVIPEDFDALIRKMRHPN